MNDLDSVSSEHEFMNTTVQSLYEYSSPTLGALVANSIDPRDDLTVAPHDDRCVEQTDVTSSDTNIMPNIGTSKIYDMSEKEFTVPESTTEHSPDIHSSNVCCSINSTSIALPTTVSTFPSHSGTQEIRTESTALDLQKLSSQWSLEEKESGITLSSEFARSDGSFEPSSDIATTVPPTLIDNVTIELPSLPKKISLERDDDGYKSDEPERYPPRLDKDYTTFVTSLDDDRDLPLLPSLSKYGALEPEDARLHHMAPGYNFVRSL